MADRLDARAPAEVRGHPANLAPLLAGPIPGRA
jgi:hypothetical protein